MNRYVVFDVETPNMKNDRMSAIGVTIIENNKITEEYFSLVNPEETFDDFNVELTGINAELVKDAPTFPEIWKTLQPIFENSTLVAHNAYFDLSVLKKCLDDYNIEWKEEVPYICTVQIGRKVLPGMSHKLNDMSAYFGIKLNHHQADSDSRACAEILLRYMKNGIDVTSHQKTYTLSNAYEKMF